MKASALIFLPPLKLSNNYFFKRYFIPLIRRIRIRLNIKMYNRSCNVVTVQKLAIKYTWKQKLLTILYNREKKRKTITIMNSKSEMGEVRHCLKTQLEFRQEMNRVQVMKCDSLQQWTLYVQKNQVMRSVIRSVQEMKHLL